MLGVFFFPHLTKFGTNNKAKALLKIEERAFPLL